ncbi:N-acyl homoserine lactonase family protein [Pusillimonas sp. MFBS29]|uniref:N-acyl homoserine lactonase family protein n=1 Tax=Pusillimonas sp. MFBS29 TaxID=2886690 RepID=UPI001D0FD1D9|nr:N-acyl homoserine lactonase family protein [Pusillimonas sp. MFBS29]MCC2595842.1 N-acyl homoserine lactonase family protein [Pusillimonas sp. MFBS29]
MYEVYAIKYASVARRAADNFLVHDLHDGQMDLDFYFWLIQGENRNILVDTGFSACSAAARNRSFLQSPEAALAKLGQRTSDIDTLILTHLHYDHAGNVDAYPNAQVHIQDAEMQYATGRYMCYSALRHFFSVDDVATVLKRVYEDKVTFHDGDAQIAPGIELYKIGGHTAGLQIVRVMTRRGWIVLASDAMHYYRNYQNENPFPAIVHVDKMLDGYRRISALVESDSHIIPGHDPQVAHQYPYLGSKDEGIYCLHETPDLKGEQHG